MGWIIFGATLVFIDWLYKEPEETPIPAKHPLSSEVVDAELAEAQEGVYELLLEK